MVEVKLFNPEIIYAFKTLRTDQQGPNLHDHPHLEISFILEGEACYQIADKEYDLPGGSILLLNPGVVHGEYQKNNTQSYQLHLGIGNINIPGYSKNTLPVEEPILKVHKWHHRILQLAWEIVEELENKEREYLLVVKAKVIEILALLLRGSNFKEELLEETNGWMKTKSQHQSIVNEAVYIIETHYYEDIQLEDLAKELLISPNYLSSIFKDALGVSPTNYLIDVRLKTAKSLLESSNLPVKDIAEAVGYQDPSYFTKSFRKKYGLSPSAYRQNLEELN